MGVAMAMATMTRPTTTMLQLRVTKVSSNRYDLQHGHDDDEDVGDGDDTYRGGGHHSTHPHLYLRYPSVPSLRRHRCRHRHCRFLVRSVETLPTLSTAAASNHPFLGVLLCASSKTATAVLGVAATSMPAMLMRMMIVKMSIDGEEQTRTAVVAAV